MRTGTAARRNLYAAVATALLFAAPGGHAAAADVAAAPSLDEVVVTGERTGPGLWHLHRAGADVWIIASLSPLPKGITWRSKQLEGILQHTDRVLVPKPFEVGIVRVLWLLITERNLLMVPGGKRLKDVMPPALYARFAVQRARYEDKSDKWERYRPIIAVAFLQQAAFHSVELSTRLDLGAAVRMLAKRYRVPVEELKIAGMHDVMDALKTLPAATENACVEASLVTVERDLPRLVERAQAWATGNVERIAKLGEPAEVDACRAALDQGVGAKELIDQLRRTWLEAIEKYFGDGGTTVAVVNMDMLLEKGGLLDELEAKGYVVDSP